MYNNGIKPCQLENVNYKFIHNKDGKYAWRPFQLIHPALYVDLINKITSSENWQVLKKRFKEFSKNSNIRCYSIPCESVSKKNDKASTIKNWWNMVEQNSIKLALDYKYVAYTDITDCYGSIYTHSIAWAIHGITVAKKQRSNKDLIGNIIDSSIQNMSYGQTNGIPQGSNLMDFIAEIVLGYCDLLLTEKIQGISDYKIIRYRDDYRIFTNDMKNLNYILKSLSEILVDLNMKLNSQKTFISDDIISTSIKKEKINLLYLYNDKKLNLQKKLLKIRKFSLDFPNCGALKTVLTDIYKKDIEILKRKPSDIEQLISIIVDIMYSNPCTYHVCVAILSKLLSFKNVDLELFINKIETKFREIPNVDYLSIWLQRITILNNRKRSYQSLLCQKLYNPNVQIWDSTWLSFALDESLIINEAAINNITAIIPKEEIDIFGQYNFY